MRIKSTFLIIMSQIAFFKMMTSETMVSIQQCVGKQPWDQFMWKGNVGRKKN